MPSSPRRFRGVFRALVRSAFALAVAVLPPALLARSLHAEGPSALLAAWSSVVVLLASYSAAGTAGSGLGKRSRIIATVAATAAGVLGAAVALVQLNVARRSLAEAWIELARRGEAFGFFSFFASELYALFCIGSSLLILARRPSAALASLVASLSFTAGIIGGDWRLLAAALASGAAVPILAVRGRPGQGLWNRLRSSLPPAVAALVLALPFAFFEDLSPSGPLFRPIDLTPLVRGVSPSFPLLLDVPGYGYDIGGSHLAPGVYLSDGVLFDAEGDGSGLRYIVSAVYSDWTEGGWIETREEGEKIDVARVSSPTKKPLGALRLRLSGEFYSVVPVERSTVSVFLSADAPAVEEASRNRGVRFQRSARRGLVADLEGGGGAKDTLDGGWLNAGIDASGRLQVLASDLVRRGERLAAERGLERDEAVIDAILAHFREGYAYALQVGDSRNDEAALERFLFEEKRGYCLYYATAFTLLVRRAGIPARMVEGFRVRLNERGRGTVRGVDAHAWGEAWIDGRWRVFEATPPFAVSDPFSYLASADSAARRQLETIFGRAPTAATPRKSRPALIIVLIGAASVLSTFIAFIVVSRLFPVSADAADIRAARRRAARFVARTRKLGIAGPEVLGWTGWAASVKRFLSTRGSTGVTQAPLAQRRIAELNDAEKAAEEMLRIAFDAASRETFVS